MKLLLLHGPAVDSSRAKLSNFKKAFNTQDMVIFEKGSDMQIILGSLMTPSLLPNEQLIILENPAEDFTSYVRPAEASSAYTLTSNTPTLILWFDHEVSSTKPILRWVKSSGGEIFYFPESREVSVFPFLDCLASRNKKAFLEMEKLKNANFDIFYFITMVFYLLRNLVAAPKNAPAFVKNKLNKQRTEFNLQDIKNCYKDILEIEFKLKSGLMEVDVAEFLLVNQFLRY